MGLSTTAPLRRVHIAAYPFVAVFLVLHGLAHFAGTSNSLTLISDDEPANYLGGAWSIGNNVTLSAVAVLWALLGWAFILTGVLVWRRDMHASALLAGVAAASLTLSVIALWAAVIGVVIDAALLVLVWGAPGRLGLRVAEAPQAHDYG